MGHDIEKYQIGGGILSIAQWTGTTPPTEDDYVDMGNCPDAEIFSKVDVKSHECTRQGTVVEDMQVPIKTEVSIKFSLDELGVEQLAMYFQAIVDSDYSIRPLTATLQEYALLFTPDYETGEEWQYEIWRVQLSAASALKLINMKDFSSLHFNGKVLADFANHPTNPFWGMTMVTG